MGDKKEGGGDGSKMDLPHRLNVRGEAQRKVKDVSWVSARLTGEVNRVEEDYRESSL